MFNSLYVHYWTFLYTGALQVPFYYSYLLLLLHSGPMKRCAVEHLTFTR